MEKYVIEYIEYLTERKKLAENTIAAYEQDLYHFLRFLNRSGISTLERVKDTNCKSYLLALEQEGLMPASITRKLASLRGFFDFCMRRGYVKEHPTEQVKAARVVRKETDILEMKQIRKLLELPDIKKPKGLRDRAILEFFYATGMKATELTALLWEDVNLKLGYICVRNGKKERVIQLPESMAEVLREYRKVCAEDEVILFPARGGEPFTRQGIWKLVRAYGVKLGMSELSPQMLRDSFIAHMLQNGADLTALQEILGVSDFSFVGQYTGAGRQSIRDAYKKVIK